MQKTDLAQTLRSWRKARNLTQEQAAKQLGISTDTLRNYEQGRRTPSPLALAGLMAKLESHPVETPLRRPVKQTPDSAGYGDRMDN